MADYIKGYGHFHKINGWSQNGLLFHKERKVIYMEKVILFNVPCKEEIKKLFTPMHLQVTSADARQYNDTLKNIADGKTDITSSNPFTGKIPDESLMLFCGISDKKLDKILFKLRNNKDIQVTYKAVLTPSNSGWTARKLFLELAKEQAAYDMLQKQQDTP